MTGFLIVFTIVLALSVPVLMFSMLIRAFYSDNRNRGWGVIKSALAAVVCGVMAAGLIMVFYSLLG
jgi:hypothetical protein